MEISYNTSKQEIRITHNFGQVTLSAEQAIELLGMLEDALDTMGMEYVTLEEGKE